MVFSARLLDFLTRLFVTCCSRPVGQPACLPSSPHYPSILSAFRKKRVTSGLLISWVALCVVEQCHCVLWNSGTVCCGTVALCVVEQCHCVLWNSATVCCGTVPPHSGTHTDEFNSGIWWRARLQSCPGHLLSWLRFS
jgi:hypothetical protein